MDGGGPGGVDSVTDPSGPGPAPVPAGEAAALAQARAAVADLVPRLVSLLRGVPDASVGAVGTWTVGDVAAHLSHVVRVDTEALAGRPVPPATVTAAGVAELNDRLLDEDRERDPSALADRLGALAEEFDDTASRSAGAPVGWLHGVRLAPSAVACHLVEECLIHGHDIARAVRRPWSIPPHHALLAIERGVLPLVEALPPRALVHQRGSGARRARVELRLRGGGRTVLVLDRGALTLDATGTRDVDAHVWAAPEAFMLVFIGRQGIARPVLRGRLAAWGRRPWRLPRLLAALSPP